MSLTVGDALKLELSPELLTELSKHPPDHYLFITQDERIGVVPPTDHNLELIELQDRRQR